MAMLDPDNPYIPGTGIRPPRLAGRVREKAEIVRALTRIKKAPDKQGSLERVSPFLVLIGPRGVGKTVLLDWAESKARELGVQCVELDEKLLGGPETDLGEAVMGGEDYEKAASERTITWKYGHPAATLIGIEGQTAIPAAVFNLGSVLDRQMKKSPLLLILDEAHAVAPELLRWFCVVMQRFLRRRRPLALLMAGTPGLRGALRGIGSTFMERSQFMSLNLLDKEEASEALSVPASDSGVPIESDALKMLVE